MKIDISRDTFDSLNDYTRVLLQQGRPILDCDWNEQTAIALHQFRAVMRAIYGSHGGPAGGQCGFIPFIADKKLSFSNGYYTVDGLHLVCGSGNPDQQYCTYAQQKYCSQDELADRRTYLVYLEAMEREVTPAENADLLDTALLGVDAAARGQAIWRIRATDWTDIVTSFQSNAFCREAVEKVYKEWLPEQTKRLNPPSLPELDTHQEQHLRDFPNQLLRYECHSIDATSVWKFSGDNAFALFNIVPTKRGDSKTIEISIGTLRTWLPAEKDHVELLTVDQIRFSDPGELCEIAGVNKKDEQNLNASGRMEIILKNPDPTGGASQFLRVWNGQIKSSIVNDIKPGDYWQLPVRDKKASPIKVKRPPRHYAPLALVCKNAAGSIDILNRFQRIALVPWREVNEELDCPIV